MACPPPGRSHLTSPCCLENEDLTHKHITDAFLLETNVICGNQQHATVAVNKVQSVHPKIKTVIIYFSNLTMFQTPHYFLSAVEHKRRMLLCF